MAFGSKGNRRVAKNMNSEFTIFGFLFTIIEDIICDCCLSHWIFRITILSIIVSMIGIFSCSICPGAQCRFCEMCAGNHCGIRLSRIAAEVQICRAVQPLELSRRANRDHCINLTAASILYRHRIVSANSSTVKIRTVSCRCGNFQILERIRGIGGHLGGCAAVHGVQIRSRAANSMDCGGTITSISRIITWHMCDCILHHNQLLRHNHVAAHGGGADTVGEGHRVMVGGVIGVGKCHRDIIRVVRGGHHIRVRDVGRIRERPCDRGVVVDHTTKLGSQRHLTDFRTYLIVRMCNGNFRLDRDTHRDDQITCRMAVSIGGFHMVGQRDIAIGVIDQRFVIHRSLVSFTISTGNAIYHTHIRRIP